MIYSLIIIHGMFAWWNSNRIENTLCGCIVDAWLMCYLCVPDSYSCVYCFTNGIQCCITDHLDMTTAFFLCLANRTRTRHTQTILKDLDISSMLTLLTLNNRFRCCKCCCWTRLCYLLNYGMPWHAHHILNATRWYVTTAAAVAVL